MYGSTWFDLHQTASVVLSPANLRRTGSVALIVGTTFFAMNQLGVILSGHATAVIWFKAALTYLTPLLVSNYGVVCATRRAPSGSGRLSPRQGDGPGRRDGEARSSTPVSPVTEVSS